MAASLKGRILHFGIREHAMAAMVNGLNLHGAWRAFGATFLQFADYCRPSLRLAAFMRVPSVFLFTHDSIFLGEDGPTHQAVEHLASLRVMPCMTVWRPADGLETAMAWCWSMMKAEGPVAMALTRQKVENLPYASGFAPRQIWKGGYVLLDAQDAKATLIGTGSETALCVEAAKLLSAKGLKVRVVSMPSVEVFQAQDEAYRSRVLGNAPLASVEAGVTHLWRGLVGPQGLAIGVDRFGASAPTPVIAEKFGFTPAQVAEKVEVWIKGCGPS
jgi:transketolase